MKPSPIKTGLLGVALLTLFAFSFGLADDFSDFEKLLQETIRTNQNNAATESKPNGTASGKVTGKTEPSPPRTLGSATEKADRSSPAPGTPAKTTVTTKPINPNGAGTQRPAANTKTTSPEVINDGWTTIQPNAPGTAIPEPKVPLTPPAKTPPVKIDTQETPFEFFTESDKTVSNKADAQSDAEIEEQAELFEPDPIKTDSKNALAEESSSEPPFDEYQFDEVLTVIEDEEFKAVEPVEPKSVPEFKPEERTEGSLNLDKIFGELETITEPKKVNQSLSPIQDSPQKDELSAALEELENVPSDDTEGNVPDNSATVPQIVPDFDSEDDETVWKVIGNCLAGDPYAQEKLKLMYNEVISGLRTRNINGRYEMWKDFSKGILRDTAGINTNSELDGRCRLTWHQKLYAEPIHSTFDAEEYSRELFVSLSGGHRHLAELMPGIRERMDIPKREDAGIKFPLCTTPIEALAEVKRCLLITASSHARAFSTLTPAELMELDKNFVETFVGKTCVSGHTIPARSVGRKHVDIMDKIDKAALYDGAEALIPLTNTALLDLLAQLPDDALPQIMMSGQKVQRFTTVAGDIIIGGHGRNVYDLDSPEMRDVVCVISRGEEDIFREGTCNMNRPVLVVIAMGRRNTFVGTKPGIQGGSVMGISMLLDRSEVSTYSAADVAQGSTMGGVGILINYGGTSTYKGLKRIQGHALLGLGMLIHKGNGNASYKASMWAQGFGAPGGYGLIHNSGGNNYYYCGGLYLDSYPEHPGYDGWGQGIGAGIRQVANGGIGIILSGEGDDVYEVDYFGHGGGYWLGVGIARDFGGSDSRHGTTLTTYSGSPRPSNGAQPKWTRFANGFGCHYALGYCFDDGGNDLYGGSIMGTGMAWDLSFGTLCDFSGSGRYTATGNMTQGVGAEASIGILFSYGGDDTFASRSQGFANPSVTYHPPASGGNFSFMVNYGGEDKYGCGVLNNTYAQRGTPSGFLIDRPTETEASEAIVALRQAIDTRNREIADYDVMVAQMREEAAQRRQRYIPPRQRRPQPIADKQLIGAVPDFGTAMRSADASETKVK